KYEHGERLWAALSKAIYEQAQAGRSWHRRTAFKVHLQWRRLGGLGFVGRALLAPLALGLISLVLELAIVGRHSL
ncbi:MAG TPA: hypothetical protein VFC52_01045, partial [Solirubrobacterales bacterium]|nr:hypothetical protein [Solirubrobacterales bacterium]